MKPGPGILRGPGRHRRIPGVPVHVTASALSLTVLDVDASREFFCGFLGYEVAMAADGFAALTRDDGAVDMVWSGSGSPEAPAARRVPRAPGLAPLPAVPDVTAEEERLRTAGARITVPLHEETWGDRLFEVTDPNGLTV